LSSYHFYPLFFENKPSVYQALLEKEIYPGMHYKRNDGYAMYRSCLQVGKNGSVLEGAQWYESRELTLPLHLALTDEDIGLICETVAKAVG
jgi:dTDP-4-amino-4,6-dideoxygalactose transaminase